jgi:hypothetical protein
MSGAFQMANSTRRPTKRERIENEFLALVGHVVVRFSRIERTIDLALWGGESLAPKGHYNKKKQARLLLTPKLETLRAIYAKISKSKSGWLDKAIAELVELSETRNIIVHGYCTEITKEKEPRIVFGKSRYSPIALERETLRATRKELIAYLHKLASFQATYDFHFLSVMTAVQQRRSSK